VGNDLYARFVIALVFIVALIGAVAWVARRYTGNGGLRIRRNAGRRVSIVEVTPIDAKHRLVLLRRDDTEHLVLLGPVQDLLIERGIPIASAPNFAEHLSGGAS
jgi:flagellar protein FliO/FliZ